MNSSIMASLAVAGSQAMSAASSVATDGADGMIAAAVALQNAKASVGVAAILSRTQDEMMQSTIDMLV